MTTRKPKPKLSRELKAVDIEDILRMEMPMISAVIESDIKRAARAILAHEKRIRRRRYADVRKAQY